MRSTSLPLLVGLSLAATLPSAWAASPTDPAGPAAETSSQAQAAGDDIWRITHVTLSSGGVAQVRRQAELGAAGAVHLDVPLAQVDDVLKSLLVNDPAGAVQGIRLDGLSPVAERFATLPVDANSVGALSTLLPQLRGVPVRVTSGGRSVEGAVLGIETVRITGVGSGSGDPATEQRLSVLTSNDGIDVLRVGADATLEILDGALRKRLAEAVAATGRAGADTRRNIAIDLLGTGQRTVTLTYVTSAPLWKPAFRLVLANDGPSRLQGWAVLENATGKDWRDVDLTLVSGAPVTFSQKLHERYWRNRVSLPVSVGVGETPRTDQSAAVSVSRPAPATARARQSVQAERTADAAPPPPSPAPLASPAAASPPALAQETMTNVSFHLPGPVALAQGQTLSVPFVDLTLPTERLAVFQPETGTRHPVSAVMVKNTSPTTLPPGILTVFEQDTGFLGDAAMPALPAGESRLASFAADRKIEVSSQTDPDQRLLDVRISEGVAHLKTMKRQVTTYRIKGAADAARTLIIEHPRQAGWTTRSEYLESETATHHRLRVALAAGASLQVQAIDEQPGTDAFALADSDEAMLLSLVNAPASPELQARIKTLAQQRRAWAGAERQRMALDGRIEQAADDQARLRENLGAVPSDSELGRRYLDLLARSENQIAAWVKQRDQAAAQEEKLKEAFLTAIAMPS